MQLVSSCSKKLTHFLNTITFIFSALNHKGFAQHGLGEFTELNLVNHLSAEQSDVQSWLEIEIPFLVKNGYIGKTVLVLKIWLNYCLGGFGFVSQSTI